jgi:hypothetical protein
METISSLEQTLLETTNTHEVVHLHDHDACNRAVSMDTLGIVASTVCLIHCASMPFLITLLPMVGLEFLKGHTAHRVLAFFVVAFACLAIFPGYLKHRDTAVLISMLTGVGIVLLATFGSGALFADNFELPLITVGNLIVVLTHLRNRRLCKH